MGDPLLPLYAGTAFFGFLLIIMPLCCAKSGPNKGIIQCSMILSIISMWIFWATVFIAQLNPLVGPRHKNITLIWYKQAEISASMESRRAHFHLHGNKDELKRHADQEANTEDVEERLLRSRPSHCHAQPDNLFQCCNTPWLPKRAKAQCMKDSIDITKLTCKEARCAFQEAGWSEMSGVVKLPVVTDFYDRVERNDPDWAQAVRHIKEECLLVSPKYQGIYTDCPEYDILYCAAIKMFQHAPLLSWSTAAACLPTQQFLGQCPVCPADCNRRTLRRKPASAPRCQACMAF